MDKLFKQARPVLEKIERAGFEAFFVGGAVRDFLLNKEINDVDIATSATPDEVKQIFDKTVDVGIEHGTILVIYLGFPYEVTTFRTESEYADFRRPAKVEFIRSLAEDLKRRDFTMNAIAMDKDGVIVDPFHGRAAIEKEVISTVGRPEHRFQEDALRMMRAVRFLSQLSFSIDENTYNGLKQNAHLLKMIAVERILTEFNKLITGKNKKEAVGILLQTGLYQYLPQLEGEEQALEHMASFNISELTTVAENWTFLLHLLKKQDVDSFLRSWKMSVKQMKELKKNMLYLHKRLQGTLSQVDLFHAGLETALSTEKVYSIINGSQVENRTIKITEAYNNLPIHDMKDLAVNGNDLLKWTEKKNGPWIREALMYALKAVLEQNIANDKEAIRELLRDCNQI